jgi:hypothetical protein
MSTTGIFPPRFPTTEETSGRNFLNLEGFQNTIIQNTIPHNSLFINPFFIEPLPFTSPFLTPLILVPNRRTYTKHRTKPMYLTLFITVGCGQQGSGALGISNGGYSLMVGSITIKTRMGLRFWEILLVGRYL